MTQKKKTQAAIQHRTASGSSIKAIRTLQDLHNY